MSTETTEKKSKQSYQEQKEAVKAKQHGLSYKEIRDMLKGRNEFILELDRLQPQRHIWIDRGAKMTCEGAGHESHAAWKIRK